MDENYTTYNALDFAQDSRFIQWVKTGNEEARQFWEKWVKDHPEKARVIREAKQLVLAIRFEEEEPPEQQIKGLWSKIDRQIGDLPQEKGKLRRISLKRWLAYAAAACAALLAFFYFYDPSEVVSTPRGKHLVYYFPDSSSVELNAVSSLKFKPGRWAESRTVELEGEAFFDVKKGSPFAVITPNGKVEVLGTTFNVYARRDDFSVECFSGNVKVSRDDRTPRLLRPGQGTQLGADAGLTEPIAVDSTREATWREGKFYFRGKKAGEVFAALERQFDLVVDADEQYLDKTVNAFFELGDPDTALYKVTWPMGLVAQRNGNRVKIIAQ